MKTPDKLYYYWRDGLYFQTDNKKKYKRLIKENGENQYETHYLKKGKKLDNLVKEDLDTFIDEMKWSINEQAELYDYDKQEMMIMLLIDFLRKVKRKVKIWKHIL